MFDTKPTRRDWLVFLFMLILVPLAGEPKIHPFTGDFANFRVSFGSPVFLLFLLWLRPFPRLFTGTCAGLTVMLFRTALDVCLYGQPLGDSFALHVPTFFYYFGYALFFALPQLTHKTIYAQALEIAFWAIIAEVFASVAELAAMNAIAYQASYQLTLGMLGRLLLIAVFRCFFILSFFFLFQLYNTEVRLARKTKEQHRLSLLISSLYEEAFELKCALRSAEDVTHDCYQVYDAVKNMATTPAQQAIVQEILRIAGQCHEIKKTHQRIYAGLQELTSNRHVEDYLPPDQIVRLLVHTQEKYARSLNKDITFHSEVPRGLPPLHVFLLLSLLGNLVANAVEAIHDKGQIFIQIQGGTGDDKLRIHIGNTGSAIPPHRLSRVFHPGYTTKFDSTGKASSGVGLTYVRHQVENLGGTIAIDSDGQNTVTCDIVLPCHKLHKTDTKGITP
ncbi:two-component system, sensor histidine kinase YcbA [Selenomonas sp. GACV-9]|uniref:sensor histidine kinase n=1 Tax=Selenomonas sp. GACV-9 TaxID=3158782 RepID=UPI0008E0750C|nr:two-component system, sensor histidine kinase YcbA [Selenomonas ruminantium]